MAAALADQCAIPVALARVLIARDVQDPEAIGKFLSPNQRDLRPPSALPDMDIAVERIRRNPGRRANVVVEPDYGPLE